MLQHLVVSSLDRVFNAHTIAEVFAHDTTYLRKILVLWCSGAMAERIPPGVLDELDEGDEKAPRVRPVHDEPLQQDPRDLLLDDLLQKCNWSKDVNLQSDHHRLLHLIMLAVSKHILAFYEGHAYLKGKHLNLRTVMQRVVTCLASAKRLSRMHENQ